MNRLAKALLGIVVVSSFAVLLAACGGGGSSQSDPTPPPPPPPPAAAITAQANIPASATAGAKFTVSVSLTSSGSSGGTASVQLVDVGSVTPTIDCGQPQTLDIGGSSATFTCQAPAVVLGSSNTHQLQVDVNGTANLESPVAVAVANGGTVKVQLTNSSGSAISAAAPGQAVNVAFSTATTPAGMGNYTVTAPSGWTVANGGTCAITAQSSSCTVSVTVAATAANGTADIRIAREEGSSALSSTLLPISVQSQTPSNDMSLFLAQNISDTLYANLPSQATAFTYQPVFLFQNTSGGTVTITSVSATGLTNVQHACNAQVQPGATYAPSAATQACALPANGLYAVFGDLNNTFTPAPSGVTEGVSAISVSLQGTPAGGSATILVQHDQNVVFVKYVPGHVAVRIVNQNASYPLHVANDYAPGGNQPNAACPSATGTCMVTFDASNVGTAGGDPANGSFNTDQIELPAGGGVIYLPYQNSGRLYLTRGAGDFVSSKIPSVTGNPVAPPYLLIEPTYVQNLAGAPCPLAGPCESLTVDQSYVDHFSVPGSFNIMGNVSNPSQVPGAATLPAVVSADATHGTTTSLSQQEIFQNVADYLNNLGSPWAYDATRGTPAGQQNYIQEDSGSIVQVLAPIAVYQVSQYNPMASDYYVTYISDIFTYVKNNPLYVQTTLAGDVACILEGTVPASGPNAGDLVFNQYSGTCPPGIDSPNGMVFANLTGCDFLGAAGQCPNEPDGLYGVNDTYRSQVGETLAAYQAIGLLPCAGTDPGAPMSDVNARAYVSKTAQFSNPPCLTGLTQPMWNAYADAFRKYVDVYTYSYGDFLGIDGTVTFSDNGFGSYPNLYQNLPVAQPVTVYMH